MRLARRASRSDGFGRAEFLPKRFLELTGPDVASSVRNAIKFTAERVALERMIDQLKVDRGVKGQQQRMMRLFACVARVFVEANGVAAGIEALVLEDGACNVPRTRFLKILRTYHPKLNVTIAADADGLRIEGFVTNARRFSPVATAPGEFQIFPVMDAWVAQSETPPPAPRVESRWLNSR